MAGNITVKAGGTTLGVLSISSNINGVPQFFPPNFGILYKYANLTLPYSPNDPGLIYTYDNTSNRPHVNLAARFFNLLNEPSTAFPFDAGTVGAVAVSATAPNATPCLNVLNFGAVGDGITNDTAAIQCALDQAARNWNAQQAAIAQKQPLTNPGSTIVCIPSGYTFAVGGLFWGSACGRAWGTNGNWPVNPYDANLANVPWYDSFFGKTAFPSGWTAGRGVDAALFVRSGVTVQLDGTVIRIEPNALSNFAATTVFCISDDQVASFMASNVTIKGVGTIDGNGLGFVASGESVISASGDCIFALVSQNLSIQGITLRSAMRWGIELFSTPTIFPVFNPAGYFAPTAPTVYTDAPLSNTLITGVTLVNCGMYQPALLKSYNGGIFIAGSQVAVVNSSFSQCQVGVWFNGKQILVAQNAFNNCAGNMSGASGFSGSFQLVGLGASVIIVGLSNSCIVTNNTIQGGGSYINQINGPWIDGNGGALPNGYGAGNSGAAIRTFVNITPLKIHKATDIPSPMYPIDYLYNVFITHNTISNFYGRGIYTDYLVTGIPGGNVLGFYSLLSINDNNIDGCTGYGIYYQPTIYPFVQPCGNIFGDGLNWACSLTDNNLGTNGLGEGVTIAYFNNASSTRYTSINQPIPTFFGLCQQYNIGGQSWGPANATTNFNNNIGLLKCCPLTSACLGSPDEGIFTGPYCAFPYANLSMGGVGVGATDCRGAVQIVSGSAQNFTLRTAQGEVPGGNIDGANTSFTLANQPYPAHSVSIVLTATTNLSVSSGTITPTFITSSKVLRLFADYNINGNVITLSTPPPVAASLTVSYTYLPRQPQ